MAIYIDYLVGDERQEAIEEAAIFNEIDNLFDAFEMTNIRLNQMYRNAEMKVFSESGTYDDLTYLIQEADGEVVEQRDGILQKIINGIKSILSKIKNFIMGSKGKGKPDDEVEVNSGLIAATDKIAAKWNEVKGTTGGKIGIAVAAIATVAGGIALTGTVVKKKRSEVEEKQNTINSISDWLNQGIDKIKSLFTGKGTNEQSEAQKQLQPFNKVTSVLNSIASGFSKALNSVGEAVSNAGNAVENKINKMNQNRQDKANKAEAMAANKNGVLIKSANGAKYGISRSDGTVSKLVDGKWVSVSNNDVPPVIQKEALRQKGKTAVSEVNAANTKNAENKKSIASNFKPSKTITNPENHNAISINGRTGVISVKDGQTTQDSKLNSIEDDMQYMGGHKNRNLRKDLKKAYTDIMNGINGAKNTEDAINANESVSVLENDDIAQVLTESCMAYSIEDGNLNVYFDDLMTESEIEEDLNNAGYVVEFTNDDIIITEGEFVSLDESIFGKNLVDEFEEKAKDAFDEEVEDLASLFDEI